MWIKVDPANEGSFILASGIHEPALLMLTEAGMCAIPADFYAGFALLQ
jgi:hypothetical protein